MIYIFLVVFEISTIWKYIIMSILYSSLAILYGFYIFVWIMKQDQGSQEMQDIAECITEGELL
jgi:Na+/H+-translocating membrane pyrophosphatase